ncbi:S41 family peptidase [Psychrobacillus psychrodurans]|uniref:S41 family peptidase n=1 Tax=Psychrobacillus psychrodurans TaxID=126157 RepID=UPI003D046DF7
MKRFTVLAVIIIGLISAPISSLAKPLDEVKNIVRVHYKGEIPSSIEEIDSIDDIMEQLDPYSTYFMREEFEAYTNSINNTTTGIGVTIEEHVTGIQIVSTFEGGAAQQAGISPGDIILSIDGISTIGMAIQQASSIITGKEGTIVQLQVLKSNNTKEMYNIMRKKFTIPVVTNELLAGNIGYIGMNSFSDNGADLVQKAKVELQKLGATSFILDLRNNGGGYVHTAEELIGLFPNSPDAFKIVTTSESTLTKSTKQHSLFPANTKVLVNGYSASASEMTAAALLDQNSASLYGQKTYGKGSMQSFFSLSDGSILKLTIANFTGPKDTLIHKTGVKPHFVTEVGHELIKAHRDALMEVNKNYKKMSALHNVSTTKQFTITFSSNVVQNAKQKVELVKLGTTDTVPVTIELKSSKQFVVTPTAPLEKGAAYLLLIHPTFQTNAGIMMKNGAYVEVTVQP